MLKKIYEENEQIKANSEEIKKLKLYFPQYFDKDGNFKIDTFKSMLQEDEVDFTKEGYELDFLGKSYARYEASLATETVITPDTEHNNFEINKNSENLYIVGDNIDALKHLLKSYASKIKCIYIDPPYNTGNDGFVYPDTFRFSVDELTQKLGIEEEEAKRILDLNGKSTHSAWMTFMYPRLMLARDLITDDGFIFISIDDNEQANLKILCDEIFGEENFVSTLSIENNPKGRKNSDHVSVSSEYIHIYSKSFNLSHFKETIPKNASDMTLDENGRYVHNSGKRVLVGENSFNDDVKDIESKKNYSVYYNKEKNEMLLKKESLSEIDENLISQGYTNYKSYYKGNLKENTYTSKTLEEMFEKQQLDFQDGKIYEKNYKDTIRIKSQISNKKYKAIVNGEEKMFNIELTTTGAGNHLKRLFKSEKPYFSAPKNVGLIKEIIKLIDDSDFYVLDFFSGSATTSEAVMQLNSEDNADRKFILVQLPEIIQEKELAYKAGYRTLDEIGRERIMLAAKKIRVETEADIDYGVKLYRLNKPSENTMNDIVDFDPHNIELISQDFITPFEFNGEKGETTILTTWLNQDGYGLIAKPVDYLLHTYIAKRYQNSIYIVKPGLSSEDVMELVRILEMNELQINRIVVYAYSLDFNVIHELKTNLANLKNNQSVLLIERY
ncbi:MULTISPECIES: site-specific DNA-methyltransferase [Staphylococcus]|uniref:site-specific DNA-methyltransferase n=1 Tax=Staphylococcus TaxID=1279 RepID=UPI000D1AAABB|nr:MULTISPECIES: site-specific DNA-methyltransferase [Staphylococcus]PTG07614.1 restriction endonuclease subunit M [Staphylococcus chromogenes]HDX8652193.1 site-specific DNA-methyltransferase [Staphylococcus aureus]